MLYNYIRVVTESPSKLVRYDTFENGLNGTAATEVVGDMMIQVSDNFQEKNKYDSGENKAFMRLLLSYASGDEKYCQVFFGLNFIM